MKELSKIKTHRRFGVQNHDIGRLFFRFLRGKQRKALYCKVNIYH